VRGIIPILAMPYQDDETIDTACLLPEIDLLVQQGVHGVGFGFASEIARLTDACEHPDAQFWCELRALLDDLVDLVPDFAGDVPRTMAGALGAGSARSVAERAEGRT